MMTADFCWLSVWKAIQMSAVSRLYVANVAKFRTSAILSIKGTVPIVQSQHKSQGNNSNQKFTDVK